MTVWAKPGGASCLSQTSFPCPEPQTTSPDRWRPGGTQQAREAQPVTVPRSPRHGAHTQGMSSILAVLLPPKHRTGLHCAPNYKCSEILPETQPLRLSPHLNSSLTFARQ